MNMGMREEIDRANRLMENAWLRGYSPDPMLSGLKDLHLRELEEYYSSKTQEELVDIIMRGIKSSPDHVIKSTHEQLMKFLGK